MIEESCKIKLVTGGCSIHPIRAKIKAGSSADGSRSMSSSRTFLIVPFKEITSRQIRAICPENHLTNQCILLEGIKFLTSHGELLRGMAT
jgi:hypothetical protein